MNYELALKLKNAGFPQDEEGEGELLYDYSQEMGLNGYPSVYVPTLSELIEACGDRFHRLTLTSMSDRNKWLAESTVIDLKANSHLLECDSTPIEAVANLYLAIKPLGR